jgi:hypothetical protein
MTYDSMQVFRNIGAPTHKSKREKALANREMQGAYRTKQSALRTKEEPERRMAPALNGDVRTGWNATQGEWARSYFKTKGKHIDPNTRTRSRSAKSSAIIKSL